MSRGRVGIDTNVFVYAIDLEAPEHKAAKRWLGEAGERKFVGVISHQNLIELYTVLTNKKQMGKKVLSPEEAMGHIEYIVGKGVFEIVFPAIETLNLFRELARQVRPVGQVVHDVFLAATLLSNGVDKLLTANSKDLEKVKGLRVMELT